MTNRSTVTGAIAGLTRRVVHGAGRGCCIGIGRLPTGSPSCQPAARNPGGSSSEGQDFAFSGFAT
jgi:hypothetical protein